MFVSVFSLPDGGQLDVGGNGFCSIADRTGMCEIRYSKLLVGHQRDCGRSHWPCLHGHWPVPMDTGLSPWKGAISSFDWSTRSTELGPVQHWVRSDGRLSRQSFQTLSKSLGSVTGHGVPKNHSTEFDAGIDLQPKSSKHDYLPHPEEQLGNMAKVCRQRKGKSWSNSPCEPLSGPTYLDPASNAPHFFRFR